MNFLYSSFKILHGRDPDCLEWPLHQKGQLLYQTNTFPVRPEKEATALLGEENQSSQTTTDWRHFAWSCATRPPPPPTYLPAVLFLVIWGSGWRMARAGAIIRGEG